MSEKERVAAYHDTTDRRTVLRLGDFNTFAAGFLFGFGIAALTAQGLWLVFRAGLVVLVINLVAVWSVRTGRL